MAPRPLSRSFLPVLHRSVPFFTRFFTILAKNEEKKGCQNLEERERKEKRSFPFLSRSLFLPFLSRHTSALNDYHEPSKQQVRSLRTHDCGVCCLLSAPELSPANAAVGLRRHCAARLAFQFAGGFHPL